MSNDFENLLTQRYTVFGYESVYHLWPITVPSTIRGEYGLVVRTMDPVRRLVGLNLINVILPGLRVLR